MTQKKSDLREEIKKNQLPKGLRFVVSVVDTHTIVPGPNGEQFLGISVAAPVLSEFVKPLPKKRSEKGVRHELDRVIKAFTKTVDDLDNTPDEDKKLHQENFGD